MPRMRIDAWLVFLTNVATAAGAAATGAAVQGSRRSLYLPRWDTLATSLSSFPSTSRWASAVLRLPRAPAA